MADLEDAKEGIRERIINRQLMPNQQKFCQFMAEGYPQAKAYIMAYGSSPAAAKTNSYKLLQKPEVRMMIAKLKEEIGRRNQVTQDEIIENLRTIRDAACTNGKYDAAARATVALGQYLGMFREKVDVNLREQNPFKSGTAEETKERLRRVAGLNVVPMPSKKATE